MLTLNRGDTSKPITVLVNGDTTFEQAETFFVNLTSPTNATISDTQGQGTITNDDAAPPTPTFFITDVSVLEDNPNHVAAFTVTLSPSSSQTVTLISPRPMEVLTTSGNDYQSTSGTLTFDPGDTSKAINVTINSDNLVEPDETFVVNLSNAAGGAGKATIRASEQFRTTTAPIWSSVKSTAAVATALLSISMTLLKSFNRGTTTV